MEPKPITITEVCYADDIENTGKYLPIYAMETTFLGR